MIKTELSVIIVNYRSWSFLENCITSFNDFPPSISYEIIVVDNDSQDGKFSSYLIKYPNIKFFQNEGNHGFSNGCNLGARHALGEYLLFLNPDTELTEDNAIDKMVKFLKENHKTGIVSCRTVSQKSVERELLFTNPWLLLLGLIRQIYKLINLRKIREQYPPDAKIWYPEWVSGSVILTAKKTFNDIGRWNQERYWMYHEDPDLCLKVKKSGKNIALLRNITIKHVGGGASRKNTSINIMAKTEVIISSHNYIQSNTKRFKTALHVIFGITTLLTLLAKTLLSVMLFKTSKTKVYFLTAKFVLKYYYLATSNKSWKNPKLYS